MANQKRPVYFHFTDIRFYFPKRTEAKEMIVRLIEKEGKALAEINYIFCSDAYLLELNKDFLQHDTYTDIITFPYHEKGQPIHSDIYISAERVKENAQTFATTFVHELHRVLFHGALHLCGYGDKSKETQKLMRDKEDFYLRLFDVSRGTNR